MLKIVKKYVILFLFVVSTFAACTGRTYNNNITPSGISYSYYSNGQGTSPTTGALIINIHSSSTNNYYEYYVVQIYGVGGYTIQSGYNQLFVPNIWANSYNFSIEKVCTANGSGCSSNTLTGIVTINTETTSVVDAWI